MMEEISGERRESPGTERNAHVEGPVRRTGEYPDGEVGTVTAVPAGWDFEP